MISTSKLGEIPQEILLNKRLIVSVSLGIVLFVLAFIWLLKVSVPKHIDHKEDAVLVDNQAAMDMIRTLESRSNALEPIEKKKAIKETKNQPIIASLVTEGQVANDYFKLGAQAAISVYSPNGNYTKEESSLGMSLKSNVTQPDLNFTPELPNEYKQQNQQQEKQAFYLQSNSQVSHSGLKTYQYQNSTYEIKAGSVIPAMLQVEVNSDLPGMIVAKVRQAVYDTTSGKYLLIPQGSTVIGQYDSNVAYGQQRVLIAWERLIFPNGDSFDLNGQPGVDGLGTAGLKDKVNHHMARAFSSSILFSILSAGGSLGQSYYEDDSSPQAVLSESLGQQIAQTGMAIINKNLNIQPTLIIRAGARFNILLRQDLIFPSHYQG